MVFRTLCRWSLRLLLLAAFALIAIQFWFFTHVAYWAKFNPSSTAFMRARLEVMRDGNPKAQLRHQWTPYQRISPHLKRSLIAAEDAKFLEHHGFDWDGIQQAWERNRREGGVVAGGSTISQQLAKNLFFSGKRTWWRKGQEAVVTVMLEALMSKQRILEIYLNVIEWGDGVFGAEAAARAITTASRRRTCRRIKPRGWRRWRRVRAVMGRARIRLISENVPRLFLRARTGCGCRDGIVILA